MSARRAGAWLAALAAVAARFPGLHAQAPDPAPRPVFAAESESVEVDVRVTRRGEPVLRLGAADFEVRDKGRVQAVELVGAGTSAVHAVLVFDRSSSMAGVKLDQLKAAARAFLAALRDDDRVTLVAFDHRLGLVAGPAAPPATALRALDGLRAQAGTALHDAVYAGLKLADAHAGRPIVLVFSDGDDELSWLSPERVVEVAREAPAAVYAVTAAEPLPPQRRLMQLDPGNVRTATSPRLSHAPAVVPNARAGSSFLDDLARETGGRAWQAALGPDLERAFLEVLADARSRYVLRYEPSDTAPGWHPLEVRLKRGKADVRARRGYTRPHY